MADRYQDILNKYWGYTDFRGVQRDIIESIGEGHDTLGLMPTGGGKSITFQVPALAHEGVCLVVTPLIALMKDQVINLRKRGIKADAIYSGMSHDRILTVLENTVFGGVKILYVSPERLSSPLFQTKIRHAKVSFITVDEAHCISQWGYDFRPAYLQIADLRKVLPNVPVLALTATATPAVVDDIQERLGFAEKRVFRMSFERKNLAYFVEYVNDKLVSLIDILQRTEGSAIVYARSRQRTKETAEYLSRQGFSATFYHAGLETAEKDKRQKEWLSDEKRIIVATNAFGMGIDKPDVRLVVHIDCPDSIEAYFQEAGRAGRDGQPAFAVLLYYNIDRTKLTKRITDTFPDKDYIREVYDHLAYYYQIGVGSGYNAMFEFSVDKFCHIYKHFPIKTESALRILERAGYINYIEEQDNASRLMFRIGRDELYRFRNDSPEEEKLIITLMRTYSGMFSDYVFIDESLIAHKLGIDSHQVYMQLKSLAHKNIISFIPRKSTPYIRYTQRREESRHLMFSPEIYDDLKERYTQRICSMIEYAECKEKCRSVMLLDYFGEKSARKCGKCDFCDSNALSSYTYSSAHTIDEAVTIVLDLLSDGGLHTREELLALQIEPRLRNEALRFLLDDEQIMAQDGRIKLWQ